MVFKQNWMRHQLHSLAGPSAELGVCVSDPLAPKTFNTRNDVLAMRGLAKMLRFMFDWENTPQGHAYWARTVQNMVDIATIDGNVASPYKALTIGEKKALLTFIDHPSDKEDKNAK